MQGLNRLSLSLVTASALGACATAPPVTVAPTPQAQPVAAIPVQAPIAQVSTLVGQVAIPHSSFKLANGLTVIVHEDHKAPIVAVSTWYNVGSKDEPKGKSGFAHLFEHLMFGGSDNLPGDFFKYLEQLGATNYNGTTWFDRTNYFQNVPKSALERTLFMESDRMGSLLGSITQEKLDNERSIVQNEKRQRDNAPGGLVEYAVYEALFPEGHPYRHAPIGSMADLDAASLATVKQWFIDKYGPNNAVLVLAGDITAAEARPLVEKHFGAIKPGPVNVPAAADVPALSGPKSIVMKDRVAATRIIRNWAVPGLLSPQLAALDVAGLVLGGLASSRLDNILVRDEKLAVAVTAGLQPLHRIGMFEVTASVKPGVDPALVERRLDQIIAEFIANGPAEDEVQRAAMREVSGRVRGLEQVGGFGGKAVTLAEGQVYAGDSDFYRKTLVQYAGIGPAQVKAAMQQWLTRPAATIRLEPGERPPYVEAKGPAAKKRADIRIPKVKREIPTVGETVPLDFPDVQHAQLSNGIRLSYAQRNAVPVTLVGVSFDAGFAADAPSARGLQNLALAMLDQGAGGLTAQQLAEQQERLGAGITAGGSADRSDVVLSALSANLAPSLDLLAAVVQQPTFDQAEVERVRSQVLTAIAEAQKSPNSIARRVLPPLLYGENHPYATTAAGNPEAVKAFSQADLLAFQQRWLRPDNVQIFIVSSLPLAEVQQQLEERFGSWAPSPVAKGRKLFVAPPARPTTERVVLIDRPGSPQSIIMAGQVTPIDPRSDLTAITGANDVLGGSALSRINTNLRETKGWSYGVGATVQLNAEVVPYVVGAPVQADRTADSIVELRHDFREFLSSKGVTNEELERTIGNRIKELPGRFETAASVLSAMEANAIYGRPDDYYELLAGRYRAQTRSSLDSAIRSAIDPDGFVWIVVGDAAKVRPQLKKLNMPIEEIQPR